MKTLRDEAVTSAVVVRKRSVPAIGQRITVRSVHDRALSMIDRSIRSQLDDANQNSLIVYRSAQCP
jgi:hypothetical protein